MNPLKLSERLNTVASFVQSGSVLADIGSDHAYLPCYLAKQNKITLAIAGEVAKGPYESAVRNVRKEKLENRIVVRLADGLDAIQDTDQVDTVSIAGMGGTLIASILEKGKAKLKNVRRIITQPNIHSVAIRKWGAENGWAVWDEAILKEDGKLYEVVILEKGDSSYSDLELLVGPKLLAEKNEIFIEKWRREIEEWERVLESLEKAETTNEIEQKKDHLRTLITIVGKVLPT